MHWGCLKAYSLYRGMHRLCVLFFMLIGNIKVIVASVSKYLSDTLNTKSRGTFCAALLRPSVLMRPRNRRLQ